MTHWTKEDLIANMVQRENWYKKSSAPPESTETPDKGKESVLAGKIVKHCKEHGYPCQCFRQSKKARGFLVPGLPD